MYYHWVYSSASQQYELYFQVGFTNTVQRLRHNNKNKEVWSLISSEKAFAKTERRILKCDKATDVILLLSKNTLKHGVHHHRCPNTCIYRLSEVNSWKLLCRPPCWHFRMWRINWETGVWRRRSFEAETPNATLDLCSSSGFTAVGIQLNGALPPPSAPECGSNNRLRTCAHGIYCVMNEKTWIRYDMISYDIIWYYIISYTMLQYINVLYVF